MSSRGVSALLLATACQATPSESTTWTPEITTAPPGTAGESGSAGESGETSSAGEARGSSGGATSEEGEGPALDVGSADDLGDGAPVGCAGKIDFLFLISREDIMDELQTRLIDAFPEFIATIQSKFADFDYQIMVVDGGEDWGSIHCNAECPGPYDLCTAPDYPCDLMETVTECDRTLGAGSVFPAGVFASNKPCPLDGGRRYMDREQTDLAETFACAARVGVSGRGWLGEALVAAVSPQLNTWPGACNAGFLRKDALLMVTLIGDRDMWGKPNGSSGYPEKWAEAVIKAKYGNPEAIIMLDIGNTECLKYYDRLCELTKLFPYGLVTDYFLPHWGPSFEAATELVEEACAGFSPPS